MKVNNKNCGVIAVIGPTMFPPKVIGNFIYYFNGLGPLMRIVMWVAIRYEQNQEPGRCLH